MAIKLAKEHLSIGQGLARGNLSMMSAGVGVGKSIADRERKRLESPRYDDIIDCYVVEGEITLDMELWLSPREDIAYGQHGAYSGNRETAVEFYLKFC